MNVSVCLAAYNGAKFIEIQLKSILQQLNIDDEIIIVDDCSTDDTLNVINAINDPRIKIFLNKVNRGHVFSFGYAISLAINKVIFTSDQDDIWVNGRIELMKNKLIASDAQLITTNSSFIDNNGYALNFDVEGVKRENSNKNFRNILDILRGKTNYYGCAMAFKADFRKIVLPIPIYVESHDLWIAMAANIIKSNLHCDDITLYRRVHGQNASVVKRKLILKLNSRLIFLKSIIALYKRKKYNKKYDCN